MDISELPEILELPSDPIARSLRLSLVEAPEKSGLDEIRSKHEKHHDLEHGDQHSPIPVNNLKKVQEEIKDKEYSPDNDPNAPQDKGNFVLLVIGLYGLVHMLPFIFMFQANEYWMYKFRDTTEGATGTSHLAANFISLLKVFTTVPGIICTFVAAVGGHKIKAQIRIFTVLFIHSSILITNAVFVHINTDTWQNGFLGVIMGLIALMAASMALGGSGSMGLIAKLPRRYMKAQLVGEGASSIFSACLRLLSIFVTPSTIDSAFIYFSIGAALMVGTSIIFYFATQTTYFKYFTQHHKEERKQKLRNVRDFMGVFKILWPMLLLNCVPLMDPTSTVGNLVVSEFKDINTWGDRYFVTICIFLVPALTGVLGRLIFNYMDYDCSLPLLYVLVLSRELIFDVLLIFSNAQPRSHLPVYLTHDWEFATMNVVNSLTSGFVTNLMTLKTMRMVPQDRIELSMVCNMFFTAVAMAAMSPFPLLIVNLL